MKQEVGNTWNLVARRQKWMMSWSTNESTAHSSQKAWSAVKIHDSIVSFAKYGNALKRDNQSKINVFVRVLEAVFMALCLWPKCFLCYMVSQV